MMYKFSFNNKWLEKYFEHCEKAEIITVGENHHIYPKCLFGENNITIKISLLDHFKAHWYLYMAFKEYQDRNPKEFQSICFSLSSFNQINDQRRKKLQKLQESELDDYGFLICEARYANTLASSGELNPQKREDVKLKISIKHKGKSPGPRQKEQILKSVQTSIKNQTTSKDSVFVYHVISGEKTRVHRCMALILHENWQLGSKPKLLDDTLYWPEDYIRLKTQLRIKEHMTGLGLTKSKEHIDKINKNPEKIRKTADKHRGMKRSSESKENISKARKKQIEKNGGAINKGMKIFYNPNNEYEILTCYEKDCPPGWINGNPKIKRKKHYYNPNNILECKKFIPGEQPEGWILGFSTNAKRKSNNTLEF